MPLQDKSFYQDSPPPQEEHPPPQEEHPPPQEEQPLELLDVLTGSGRYTSS